MVEKELGERNFGLTRWSRRHELRHAARHHRPAAGSGQPAAGSAQFSRLQVDVKVEEPETSQNPTKSFVIHNIVWRRTQYVIWYRYLCIIWYYLDIELQDCNASVVHFLVIWITVLSDSRLWYFYNETRIGGYLSQGWEWIGGKELWLWLPQEHEPRHGGERDCWRRMSPAWDPLRDHRRRRRCLSAARQRSLSPPCRGSVYFTLMWTWKNQERRRTQRGRLRFIISDHTSFGGYNIYYIDIYVGYMIIFWYRAPGLPCVLEYLQNTAKGCVRLAIAIHPL